MNNTNYKISEINTKHAALFLALALTIVSIAPSAASALVTGSAKVDTSVSLGSDTAGSDTSAEMSVEGSAGSDSSASTGEDIDEEESRSGLLGDVLVVVQADLDGDSLEDEMMISPTAVRSSTDLNVYVRGLAKNDKNVEKVSATKSEVSIWYKQPAKFLGFIDSHITSEARVDAEGEVEVSYPWYSFFFSSDTKASASVESDIEARVRGIVASSKSEASATAELSAETQAQVLSQIHAVMQAEASISADASASAGN